MSQVQVHVFALHQGMGGITNNYIIMYVLKVVVYNANITE